MPDHSTANKPRIRRTAGFSRRLAQYSAGTLTLAGSAGLAHADFSGTYYSLTPPAAGSHTVTGPQTFGTWTASEVNYGGSSTYTLNDTNAPSSVTLTDAAPDGDSELTLDNTAASAGTLSFSYDLSGSTGYESAGYEVDGTKTYLADFQLNPSTSGTVTNVALSAGQSFGFFVDGYFGTATMTISSFSAPVPEPGAAGWIAAGAAGLLATRALRRRNARASLEG